MNFKYYHTPLKPVTTRVRCPVCHEIVYSTAGIHPQCAVRQAEPFRPKDKAVKETGRGAADTVVDPPTARSLSAPESLPSV